MYERRHWPVPYFHYRPPVWACPGWPEPTAYDPTRRLIIILVLVVLVAHGYPWPAA